MEVLAVTDYKNFARFTQLRFEEKGHSAESVFSPRMKPNDLRVGDQPIQLDRFDIILLQNMGDPEDGLRMVRGLKYRTDRPIILAVYGGDQVVKSRLESSLADLITDIPDNPEKFDALLKDAQKLISQKRAA